MSSRASSSEAVMLSRRAVAISLLAHRRIAPLQPLKEVVKEGMNDRQMEGTRDQRSRRMSCEARGGNCDTAEERYRACADRDNSSERRIEKPSLMLFYFGPCDAVLMRIALASCNWCLSHTRRSWSRDSIGNSAEPS